MTIDLETLIGAYSTLKEYIPVKDRQAAADNIMSELVEVLNEQDLKEFAGIDSYTKNAYKEYASDSDHDSFNYDE